MKAIILAGGFGTRLGSISLDVPKPMIPIAGIPFLEHQIKFLKEQGIIEIILAVHHMANKIKSYFGTGHRWGVNITYSEEETPLGTAGAVKKAERYVDDTFLVLNGDSYSQINLQNFLDFHRSKRSSFSIALGKSKDSIHYRSVVIQGDRITEFAEKKDPAGGLINSGIYLFEPIIFNYIEKEKKTSLENEVFPKIAREGILWGYKHEGYFIDIGRPETYKKFKEDVLRTLFLSGQDKVRDAMKKISKNGIDLILITDSNYKLLGVVNDRILKEFILKGGNVNDYLEDAMIRDPLTAKNTDSREIILEILNAGTNRLPILDEHGRVVDVEFKLDEVKTESFPIIRGKSPMRISFGGGGTDLPVFFKKYGGAVISSTIDKYCYGTIVKRADLRIIINSDLEGEVVIGSINDINYNGNLDLVKAVIKIMKPSFGFELYLYNDIPPGRGLGSSSSLAVLIISLISSLQQVKYDDYKIAEIAFKAEREELKIEGGWQDQYAAIIGGFNYMEFDKDKSLVYPIRIKEEIIHELNEHLLLCYIGNARDRVFQNENRENPIINDEKSVSESLNRLKEIALEIKDALLTNEINKIGPLLHESWLKKRGLSKIISNQKIDYLYDMGIKNGAIGGKLIGAGGGGYILFFCPPTKRNQLTKALKESGGEITNFNFEFGGTKTWIVKNG